MYKKRITQKKFPTNEFCSRAFARDLKKSVLGEEFDSCINFDHFMSVLNRRIDPEELFSSDTFKNWALGVSIPYSSTQGIIDKALNGLANKWFGREIFSNRFQLHLATLDLDYIGSKNSKQASSEAWSLIKIIIGDWNPKGFNNNRLEIRGPQERAGYDSMKTYNFYPFEPEKELIDQEEIKGRVEYNLTLGPTSYVDILIPEEIAALYQKENPLSIVTYMFCLLCLLPDTSDSGYKNDLFLDFLTVLNCAQFIVYKRSEGLLTIRNDQAGTNILKIFSEVERFYYDDFWSSDKILKRQEENQERMKNLKAQGIRFDIVYNHSFMSHPAFILTDILENIINNQVAHPKYQLNDENALHEVTKHIPRLLIDFRVFYLNLFKISGLSEKQVMSKLLNTFKNYNTEDCSDITAHSK